MSDYTLPPHSRVLVTGANGFIASHIINLLLQRGYLVRGTVREPRPWLDQMFQKYDRYESVVLPDLEHPDPMVFNDVAGVVLVATENSFSQDPALIQRVVQGTLAMLELAKNSAVKSVVLTSSTAACVSSTYAPEANYVKIDNDTYNDAAVAAAQSTSPSEIFPGMAVYSASKTEAERQAFKWVQENQPSFQFNTVVPDYNIGSRLNPNVRESGMAPIRAFLNGQDLFMKIFPPAWYVNVEDTARLHVAALLDPKIQSERIFATAGQFNWADVIAIMRRLRPNNSNIPDAPNNDRCRFDFVLSKRAEQILLDFFGSGWVSLEDSVAQGIADLQ